MKQTRCYNGGFVATLRSGVVALLLAFTLASFGWAQGVVSSGMTGVVRDTAGKPMPAVTLTATHLPTGTTYTAISTDAGRYNFRGMIVGGPYTLAASSARVKPAEITDITTELGRDIDVNITV